MKFQKHDFEVMVDPKGTPIAYWGNFCIRFGGPIPLGATLAAMPILAPKYKKYT